MKKQILELLKELELNLNTYYWWYIVYCHDGTGVVTNVFDESLFRFKSEEELIQKLKNKIKELKK